MKIIIPAEPDMFSVTKQVLLNSTPYTGSNLLGSQAVYLFLIPVLLQFYITFQLIL